LIHAE